MFELLSIQTNTNLSSDELFRVKELSVGSSPHFINNSRLQVQEHSSRNVFSGSGLAEEGVEGVITASDSLVRGHLTIRLDTVLQTVQFPTSITDLDTGLTKMDRDTLTLKTSCITSYIIRLWITKLSIRIMLVCYVNHLKIFHILCSLEHFLI